jgi:hypothetical protein
MMALDLRADLINTLVDRFRAEIAESRLIAEDLETTRNVTEVILTRLETHAMKLEIYNDMLRELLLKQVQTKG